MTILQSGHQTVKIDNGELVSYQVDGYEFIHQKGNPGWSSSDTEMFPIIGPVNEAGFQVTTPRGKALQDQHGLLRQFGYVSVMATSYHAVFKKQYASGTAIENSKYPEKSTVPMLSWPYNFVFEKEFLLREDGLHIGFTVSGEEEMPFMLGYHPAFMLHGESPEIKTKDRTIMLREVLDVGDRALQIADCDTIVLSHVRDIKISTEGFGHFMCWTPVSNMVCIEPITFYPYALEQQRLHEGFQYLGKNSKKFIVRLSV